MNQQKVHKAVVVSGTPGTGKTKLAKELSLLLHKDYINGTLFVKSEGLSQGLDKERKSMIVPINAFKKALKKAIMASKRGVVIDSHLAHFLPKNLVELCIITRCDIKELSERLKKRGYDKAKVTENIQAEIFEVILEEARQKGHKILVLDSTKEGAKKLAKKSQKWLEENSSKKGFNF